MQDVIAILTDVVMVLGATLIGLWVVSILINKASFIDSFWGAGFVIIAWTSALSRVGVDGIAGLAPTQLLALGLISAWGLRLAVYLLLRFLREGEDKRYVRMTAGKEGLSRHIFTLWFVFGMQGALMLIISAPSIVAMAGAGGTLTPLSYAGLVIYAVGALFEWGGDFQLARFKANPDNAGKVLDTGLWAWTRHPNYFGDAMQWWGIWLVCGIWWTAFAPALLTFMLMKWSGVPLLESKLKHTRDGYSDYRERTPTFFPRPPKAAAPATAEE